MAVDTRDAAGVGDACGAGEIVEGGGDGFAGRGRRVGDVPENVRSDWMDRTGDAARMAVKSFRNLR